MLCGATFVCIRSSCKHPLPPSRVLSPEPGRPQVWPSSTQVEAGASVHSHTPCFPAGLSHTVHSGPVAKTRTLHVVRLCGRIKSKLLSWGMLSFVRAPNARCGHSFQFAVSVCLLSECAVRLLRKKEQILHFWCCSGKHLQGLKLSSSLAFALTGENLEQFGGNADRARRAPHTRAYVRLAR